MKMIKKIKLRNLNSSIEDRFDVLICCSSFEERCLSIPNKLKRKKFKKVIIIENKNGSTLIKKHSGILEELFSNKSQLVSVDFDSPIEVADNISKELNQIGRTGKVNVLIDITTFTHETLMICIQLLRLNKKVDHVTCAYANAEQYCSNCEIRKKWLSQGCTDVRSVLGYSGMLLPSQKDHLIVIVGYEYTRAFDVISSLEPNSISLVYGSSDNALTEKDKDANTIYHKLVQDMTFEYSNVESIDIPCDSPDDINEILQEIYERHAGKNIIVVPMNSKMSTLGVALSLFENYDVQACYAPAVIYNESNYSIPGDYCYIYNLK